ncbi:MAG: hypothetical protein ACK5RC_06455 [Curvibacter sp.]
MNLHLLIASATLLLAACDIPGLGPDPRVAAREAEGKAIGGACRYALRGIEECYQLNPKALKTAVFEGWREMDLYMRENKIEGQPTPVAAPDGGTVPADTTSGGEKKPTTAPAKPAAAGDKKAS